MVDSAVRDEHSVHPHELESLDGWDEEDWPLDAVDYLDENPPAPLRVPLLELLG